MRHLGPIVWPVLLAALAGGSWLAWKHGSDRETQSTSLVTRPSAAPSLLVADPLFPDRPARIDSSRGFDAGWASAPPSKEFQRSRSAGERGGIEPCRTEPDPAQADAVALSRGKLLVPPGALNPAGQFDLVFHLHGEDAVRKQLLASKQAFVLYTLTQSPGESYAPLFAGSRLFEQLLDEIEKTVGARAGRQVQLQHVAISAWSAGFEGARSILYQPEARRIEALLLVDGLHAPRGNQGPSTQLEVFVDFARLAEQGQRFFAITHSSIPTSSYTSTTESAHHLIQTLGGKPVPVRREDAAGLELVELYTSGDLHLRGYAGNDKSDHCAQLFLLPTLFAALRQYFARHP